MLGQLYGRKGDYKTARQLLEQVTKSTSEEELRQHAEMVLKQLIAMQEQIETYERNRKSNSTRSTSGTGGATENTTIVVSGDEPTVGPQDPSSYLREVLRKPSAGEKQLQGTLIRIDCDAKGIVFIVKAGDQLLRLYCANFEQIVLTTYNPDVKGDITCGARKPEDPIIICFTPLSDKRLKRDGTLKSIEFVPANFKL
jgi:hypothetical protein